MAQLRLLIDPTYESWELLLQTTSLTGVLAACTGGGSSLATIDQAYCCAAFPFKALRQPLRIGVLTASVRGPTWLVDHKQHLGVAELPSPNLPGLLSCWVIKTLAAVQQVPCTTLKRSQPESSACATQSLCPWLLSASRSREEPCNHIHLHCSCFHSG
jgi:hypothetical protein